MRSIFSNRTSYSTVISSLVLVLWASNVVHAHQYPNQVGTPAHSVFVSTAASAQDSVSCGVTHHSACRTIQHAIYRVAFGGHIHVEPGTYFENVLIDKQDIRLESTDGAEVTLIDGSRATNSTVPEAMRIIADNVTIGRNRNRGFSFVNSVASGLFNIGSNVTIQGNRAFNNSSRGFQFGISSVDDSIDNSARVVANDPLNGATFITDALLQTQSNVMVRHNVASENPLGGFYFSAFDDSNVRNNSAIRNGAPRFRSAPEFTNLGRGSGFWIDLGSNRDTLVRNTADFNSSHGIFYRRGVNTARPAEGLVTDQRVIRNQASDNGRNGIMLMGDNLIVQDNTVERNGGDGLHFIGYDTILDISYNIATLNDGSGIGFTDFAGTMQVQPINLDHNGVPTGLGGIHHNVFDSNRSHKFPALLGSVINCGIATDVSGRTIELASNLWNSSATPSAAQRICDVSASTIVRIRTNAGEDAGPRPGRAD